MSKNQPNSSDSLSEDRERRIADERALAALKLQRKQRLQAMSIKRRRNFTYLKKLHEGGCYWLNVVLLTSNDVRTLIGNSVPKQRVESLFSLGFSLSKITGLNAGLPIARAFSQLMEEWEYAHAGPTMQGVKFVMAKSSPCVYPQMSPIDGLSDLTRPSVYKFNNNIVYEHLHAPHVPFDLDYAEVFVGLCTQLSRLYEKLVHEDCYSNQAVYDAIVRLDTRIKHHVINQVAKEVTEACSRKTKAGTRDLRSLAGGQLSSTAAGGGGTTSAGSNTPFMHKARSSPSLSGASAATAAAAAVAAGRGAGGTNSSPATATRKTAAGGIASVGVDSGPTLEDGGKESAVGSGGGTAGAEVASGGGGAVNVNNPLRRLKSKENGVSEP